MAVAMASMPAELEHRGMTERNRRGVLPTNIKANNGRVEKSQLDQLRETPVDTPTEEMHRRLEGNGYCFVKGAIPRIDVVKMREKNFEQFAHTGMLKPGTHPVDGIYNNTEDPERHRGIGGGDPEGDELKALTEAHTKEDYRAFVGHPSLRRIVRELRGWDRDVLLQRTMIRHNVPHGASTGIHYDKLFLRGGDAYFLTAWVPIGDIKPTGGGVVYLANSDKLGKAIESDFSRRSQHMTPEERISAFNAIMNEKTGMLSDNPKGFENQYFDFAERSGEMPKSYRWLIGKYEAGDVVFHHPYMIHGSCMNEDPGGRFRLSTDLRFYDTNKI